MFNSKRIAALEKRIYELEAQVIIKSYANFDGAAHGYYQRPLEIQLREAVQAVIDHLGMQLNIEQGTPERLVLQKPPKKGAK